MKVSYIIQTFVVVAFASRYGVSEEAVLLSSDVAAEEVVTEEFVDLDQEKANGEASSANEDDHDLAQEDLSGGGQADEVSEQQEDEGKVESDEQEETATATEGSQAEEATETSEATTESGTETATAAAAEEEATVPPQTGPFIDLLGPGLLSLKMIDEAHAEIVGHYTNEALAGKKVIGLYFSADWCGPCRQFTPELVAFYNRMNQRRGKTDQFEIIWISRCRDMDSFGQYFTHMNWLALPPEEAMGARGQMLSDKYKVQGIPSLVLLDDMGNVITTDARNKIPQDKTGVGFPWGNPLKTLYSTIFPKSVRSMIKSQLVTVKDQVVHKVKLMAGLQKPTPATA